MKAIIITLGVLIATTLIVNLTNVAPIVYVFIGFIYGLIILSVYFADSI